jgi:hypothetical protein
VSAYRALPRHRFERCKSRSGAPNIGDLRAPERIKSPLFGHQSGFETASNSANWKPCDK